MSRSSSGVSEHSTPSGFLKHRRSSSASKPHEVKETLTAHLSNDVSDDESGTDEGHGHGHHTSEDGVKHGVFKKLNQYRLGPVLGVGSAGTVEKAVDTETGIEYAVKEFSKSRLRKRKRSEALRISRGRSKPATGVFEEGEDEKQDALSLIRTEIAIMKKLDHPNLVRLYEVLNVPDGDLLYMVIELCPGGPVTQISLKSDDEESRNPFRHGKPTRKRTTCEVMPEPQARNYFRQMLLAVEYLHLHDIVHRDIKPENILIMEDRNVCKICDFGISEMFVKHGDDSSKRHVGSPAFMSPEICSPGNGTFIHAKATDIWALGVTLYCLVVGRLPFQSSNFLRLNELILNSPVKIPFLLSRNLRDLLSKMLDKDPNTRIHMLELRDHPWVTHDGEEPLPTQEDNAGQIVSTPTKHEVAQAVTAGVLGDIMSAKLMARRLKRNFAEGRASSAKPKRGMSLQVEPSFSRSSTSTSLDSNSVVLSSSPEHSGSGFSLAMMRDSPDHTHDSACVESTCGTSSMQSDRAHRSERGSVDDMDLETVRFVEKETGHDAVKRDEDLSPKHSRAPSRTQTEVQ